MIGLEKKRKKWNGWNPAQRRTSFVWAAVCTVLFAWTGLVQVNAVHGAEVRLGVLYSSTGLFASFGRTVPPVVTLWNERRLTRSRVHVEPIFCDVASSAVRTFECTWMLRNASVHAVVAPETFLTKTAAAVLETASPMIPVLAGMAATPDVFLTDDRRQRRFPHLLGVMTPSTLYMNSIIPYLKIHGIERFSVMTSTREPDVSVCRGAMDSILDLSPKALVSYHESSNLTDLERLWRDVVSSLQPDALFICDRLFCDEWNTLLERNTHQAERMPSAIVQYECASYLDANPAWKQPRTQFIMTPLQWDPRLRGADYSDVALRPFGGLFPPTSNETSSQVFLRTMAQQFGITSYSSLIASQLAVLYVLDYALSKCQVCNDSAALYQWMSTASFRCFYGLIRFNDVGMNDLRDMTVVQVNRKYGMELLLPIQSATSTPVLPIPAYDERTLRVDPLESGVIAAVSLTLVLCITASVLVQWFRAHPKLKGLGLGLFHMALVGCDLMTLSTLFWTPAAASDTDCSLRVWLAALGLAGMIAPLLSKTIRIYRIFFQTVLHVVRITDRQVLSVAAALMAPLLVLLSAWNLSQPLSLAWLLEDPNRPAFTIRECLAPSSGTLVWLGLVLSYLGLLCAASVFFAYRIRLCDEQYNDSKTIGYVLYNISFVVTMLGVLHGGLMRSAMQNPDIHRTLLIVRLLGVYYLIWSSILIFALRLWTATSTSLSVYQKTATSATTASSPASSPAPAPSPGPAPPTPLTNTFVTSSPTFTSMHVTTTTTSPSSIRPSTASHPRTPPPPVTPSPSTSPSPLALPLASPSTVP